ncbi:MAG: ABC transporter substrate-binding protein, partial [Betaproteobacteria bacterium]
IAAFSSAAVTSSLAARAQQPGIPVIGFLHLGSPQPYAPMVASFLHGLSEAGFVETRNVAIEYRWADNQTDRLPAMAADLVRRGVDVIAPAGGPASVRAAKTATTTIPIVFSLGSDPVKMGFVASLNRPGGNVTGVTFLANELEVKQLELLRELVPRADAIAYLVNPSNPNTATAVRAGGQVLGRRIHVFNASNERDLDTSFAGFGQQRVGALLVSPDPLFTTRREQIVTLALRHAMPTMGQFREFVAAGGLISYGVDLKDTYRQHGIYVGRILKGASPADLPVVQPTKFELVINVKTAKALGLTIPQSILLRADELIK